MESERREADHRIILCTRSVDRGVDDTNVNTEVVYCAERCSSELWEQAQKAGGFQHAALRESFVYLQVCTISRAIRDHLRLCNCF